MSAYEIKATVTIAGGPGVLVRELTFAPGEATPWHHHSQMTDRCYGLSGAVTLERRDGTSVELRPGVVGEAAIGVIHHLVNRGAEDGRVLVVQTGGRYDFLAESA